MNNCAPQGTDNPEKDRVEEQTVLTLFGIPFPCHSPRLPSLSRR